MGYDHRYESQLDTVKEFDTQSILMDLFDQCYLKKLKVAYVPQLKAADQTYLNDLKRQVGLARAKQIIMHFFSLDTFQTKTKGYTVPVLKIELNNVNVALGKSQPALTYGTAIKIKTWVFCDTNGCNKNFQIDLVASTDAFKQVFACKDCVLQ